MTPLPPNPQNPPPFASLYETMEDVPFFSISSFDPDTAPSPHCLSRMSGGNAQVNLNYWDSYQRIASKLKKRFMRKPNFNEGSEEFEELMKSLNRQGNHQYAAFCCLALARFLHLERDSFSEEHAGLTCSRVLLFYYRCEQALQDSGAEASSYVEAGSLLLSSLCRGQPPSTFDGFLPFWLARLFWESETESQIYQFSVDGSNFGYEEYLTEAINCYQLDIDVIPPSTLMHYFSLLARS